MNSPEPRRRKAAAIAATVVFHALLIAALMAGVLRYDSSEEPPEWPPADSSEILIGGEYVMIGETPVEDTPGEPSEAPQNAETETEADVEPAPEPPAAPAVTTPRESPAKARPGAPEAKTKTKPKDDSKAREEAARRDAEKKAREEAAAKIGDRVKFGTGSKAGQPDGTVKQGAVSGVSAQGLGNRKPLDLSRPPQGPLGRVIVSIKVDRSGRVTSARFLSGTGAAAASEKTRQNCVSAARASKFSADENAPASQNGTLTYNFK